jgi:hypothetical protein
MVKTVIKIIKALDFWGLRNVSTLPNNIFFFGGEYVCHTTRSQYALSVFTNFTVEWWAEDFQKIYTHINNIWNTFRLLQGSCINQMKVAINIVNILIKRIWNSYSIQSAKVQGIHVKIVCTLVSTAPFSILFISMYAFRTAFTYLSIWWLM